MVYSDIRIHYQFLLSSANRCVEEHGGVIPDMSDDLVVQHRHVRSTDIEEVGTKSTYVELQNEDNQRPMSLSVIAREEVIERPRGGLNGGTNTWNSPLPKKNIMEEKIGFSLTW